MSSPTPAGRTLGRLVCTASCAVLAGAVYVVCFSVGLVATLVALLFVFPDPCLPFCVAADTEGGGAEQVGQVVVLAGAGLACLGALYPMLRRRGGRLVLLVPVAALLALVPVTVAGLVTVDALTTDARVLTCSC